MKYVCNFASFWSSHDSYDFISIDLSLQWQKESFFEMSTSFYKLNRVNW